MKVVLGWRSCIHCISYRWHNWDAWPYFHRAHECAQLMNHPAYKWYDLMRGKRFFFVSKMAHWLSAHPPSCSVGTGVHCWVKWQGCDIDHLTSV